MWEYKDLYSDNELLDRQTYILDQIRPTIETESYNLLQRMDIVTYHIVSIRRDLAIISWCAPAIVVMMGLITWKVVF